MSILDRRRQLQQIAQLPNDNDLWIAATAIYHNITLVFADSDCDPTSDFLSTCF